MSTLAANSSTTVTLQPGYALYIIGNATATFGAGPDSARAAFPFTGQAVLGPYTGSTQAITITTGASAVNYQTMYNGEIEPSLRVSRNPTTGVIQGVETDVGDQTTGAAAVAAAASASVYNTKRKLLSDLTSRFNRARNYNARTRLAIFDDSQAVAATFTGALTGATSGTLTASINNGTWYFKFSSQDVRKCTVTGGTSVSWSGAVTATATAKYYTQVNSSLPPELYASTSYISQPNNVAVNLTNALASGAIALTGTLGSWAALCGTSTPSQGAGQYVNGGKVRWAFSGRYMEILVVATTALYYPKIDGQLIFSSGIDGSAQPYLMFDWGAAFQKGVTREFEMDLSRNNGVTWIQIDADAAFVPPKASPRIVMAGDSMTAFQYSDSGTPAADSWDNITFSRQFSDYIGVPDVWYSGLPGTGYVTDASYVRLGARLATDVINQAPDVVFFSYSNVNDATDFTAALTSNIQACRAALPNTPVLVLDGISSGSVAGNTTKAGYCAAAVTACNDSMVQLVKFVNGNPKPITGTGYQGAAATNTPSDWFFGPSGNVHPTLQGQNFIAPYLADAYMAAITAALT